MPGSSTGTSGFNTPDHKGAATRVNGFQAENELRDLQFKLTHKLQSTLDVVSTLELFFQNVRETIKMDGLLFEPAIEGEAPFEIGKKASHRAQYTINSNQAKLGTLTFLRKRYFLEGELAALEMFVSILFYPLRNALLYREALASSLRDALTGIGNRAAMELAFSREVKLAKRHKYPLCLLFVDLDHFKQVNDNFGHRAGDRLIQHTVKGIQSALRDTDQVFRYGGEEFVIILNNTELECAKLIAERIRVYIAMTPLTVDKKEISATISVGVSTLGSQDSADALLKRSDSALYIAKNSGRNRVVSLGTKAEAAQQAQKSKATG